MIIVKIERVEKGCLVKSFISGFSGCNENLWPMPFGENLEKLDYFFIEEKSIAKIIKMVKNFYNKSYPITEVVFKVSEDSLTTESITQDFVDENLPKGKE